MQFSWWVYVEMKCNFLLLNCTLQFVTEISLTVLYGYKVFNTNQIDLKKSFVKVCLIGLSLGRMVQNCRQWLWWGDFLWTFSVPEALFACLIFNSSMDHCRLHTCLCIVSGPPLVAQLLFKFPLCILHFSTRHRLGAFYNIIRRRAPNGGVCSTL